MNHQWLVAVLCATFGMTQVAGFSIEGFDAWEREWKVIQCGPKGVELETEGWNCSRLEPKEVSNAFYFCRTNVYPDGDLFDYMKAACENKTLFEMYDTCVDSFKDEVFIQKVEGMDEAMECFAQWLRGHGLESEFWKLDEEQEIHYNETSTTTAEEIAATNEN